MQSNPVQPRSRAAEMLINKVPEVTLLFWIIKMMSTTVGETAADFLNADLGFGLGGTTWVTGALLAVMLTLQLRAKRCVPALYWLTVLLISVFGTLVTDNLTDVFGMPLAASSAGFGAALVAVFALWYARERTLSIHHVDTRARELFYWLAILVTFALGTAAGDWFAEGLNLGFPLAAAVFGLAIAAVTLAWFRFKASPVACFWIAYILTRPFGAAMGDYLSQGHEAGGLGLGASATSEIFVTSIVGLVIYLSLAQRRLGARG